MTLLTILEKINKNKLLTRTYFDISEVSKENYNLYKLRQDPLIADIVGNRIQFVFNRSPYSSYSIAPDGILTRTKTTQKNIETRIKEIAKRIKDTDIGSKEYNDLEDYLWMYEKGYTDCTNTVIELEKVIRQLNEFYNISN